MALNKTGMSYYSVDTDRYQDLRIKKLKKNFGTDGLAIYDYILCEVYRVKGCFLEWDESTVFDVADYFNAKESLIKEVVNYCAVVGLFHKGLLESGSIITSQSIQSRYLDACHRMKRKDVAIPEKCMIPPEESKQIREECKVIPEQLQQSKVKETKEKESKVNRANALVPTRRDDEPRRQELKKKYTELVERIKGAEVKIIFTELKNFVQENRPDWAEPYVDSWNIFANTYRLPQVEAISDSRRKKLNTRAAEPSFDFFRILEKIKQSNHLRGGNDRGWKVTFDWIMDNDKNYLKILEDNY